jgi:hypothetical protein
VNDLPIEGFYPPIPGYPSPGTATFNWLFVDMLFMTEVRGDLESAVKANGRITQNAGHVYSLNNEEKTYLATLGVPVQSLLDAMNARPTIVADEGARQYIENFYDLTGKLRRPLISMHTKIDGLVIPANESALLETVAADRKAQKLVQTFTNGIGHCAFTPDQWLSAVTAMDTWLDTNTKPDASFFPEALGFDNNFTPPTWPQP